MSQHGCTARVDRSVASCSGHSEAGGSGACAENDTEAIAKAVARGDDPHELSDTDDAAATDEQVPSDAPSHNANQPKQFGLSTAVSGTRRKRALWTAHDEERLITVSRFQYGKITSFFSWVGCW